VGGWGCGVRRTCCGVRDLRSFRIRWRAVIWEYRQEAVEYSLDSLPAAYCRSRCSDIEIIAAGIPDPVAAVALDSPRRAVHASRGCASPALSPGRPVRRVAPLQQASSGIALPALGICWQGSVEFGRVRRAGQATACQNHGASGPMRDSYLTGACSGRAGRFRAHLGFPRQRPPRR
jgi:hypothetical protein